MAENRRDFQRLARMRLRDARVLIRSGNLEAAYYLTGLAVECAVKACIAKNTRRYDFPPNQNAIKEIYTHDLAKLIRAAKLETALDTDRKGNILFKNKWDVLKDWNVNTQIRDQRLECKGFVRGSNRKERSDAMATAALVNRDIEVGRHIVAALTRANIPVTVYLWALVSEEWLFIIATPLVDSKGPLAAYDQVNRALQRAGVLTDVPRQMILPDEPQ